MNKLDLLSKIALNEAPLSSYVKSVGSKVLNPAAYARGAGSVLRGAGKAAGGFTTSTKSLAGTLGGAGNIASGVGGALSKTGQWLKDPGAGQSNKKETTTQQTQQTKGQKMPSDMTKAKTDFIINNRQIPAKYVGDTANGYPIYRIKGLNWAQSIVLEPKDKNKFSVYMYADKKPNIKKPPAVIRPGSGNFSGVQNKLVITTK